MNPVEGRAGFIFTFNKFFILLLCLCSMKYILGIETTAHTFGVAVLEFVDSGKKENARVLSNEKDSFVIDSGGGGMIPIEVAKHHEEIAEEVYHKALGKAGILEEDLVAVAVSNAPGLAPCLLEGFKFSKTLCEKLNIPLILVNHCVAHLEIGKLVFPECKDPVLLYASGANTQVIAFEGGKYRIFGETLDLGVGNFIDTIARHAGLGFPGGPKIQELAEKSSEDKYIELPYSIKGMDVSFSGLQTKIRQLIDAGEKLEDVAFSLQETVFAMLVESAERALAHTGKKELLLGGGVACNKRLQEMCKIMCAERNAKCFIPQNSLLVDNAAMIGYLGLRKFLAKKYFIPKTKSFDEADIAPRERTDDVVVDWV